MADVFISYKSERRPAISHLARVIENYGYSVWFDYALMPGGSFSAQIERELRAARAVIVVWCSMSVRSVEGKTNWVVEEADLAKQLGTYLPVWLEPVDLPLGFRMGDVIDISEWNGDPRSHEIDRLIEQLTSKTQREPDIKYKALVAQSADVRRSGLTNLAAYPLDKQGAQLAARNREREQREKVEAEQIAENARREAAARLAAQQALAEAQARLEAEQRLKQEQEAADALAKAEQERQAKLAEEERQQKALEEAAAKLREEQRLKDEAEAARQAEVARLDAERIERERLEEALKRPEAMIPAAPITPTQPPEPNGPGPEPTPTGPSTNESEPEPPKTDDSIPDPTAEPTAGSNVSSSTTSSLGKFVRENRVPLLGLGATVGVMSLVLTLASLGVGQDVTPEEGPPVVASGSARASGTAPSQNTKGKNKASAKLNESLGNQTGDCQLNQVCPPSEARPQASSSGTPLETPVQAQSDGHRLDQRPSGDFNFAPGLSLRDIENIVPLELQTASFFLNGSGLESNSSPIKLVQGLWVFFDPGESIKPCQPSDSKRGMSVKGSALRFFQIYQKKFYAGGQQLIKKIDGNTLIMNDGSWSIRFIGVNRFEAINFNKKNIIYTAIRCA